MKKTLAIMLALIMVLALVPSVAFAADEVAWINGKGYETLEAAVNAAKSGETITLGKGEYTLYEKNANVLNKDLTFVGQGADKTVWNIGTGMVDKRGQGNGDFSFKGSGTIEFQNMTLKAAVISETGEQVDRDYTGFAHTTNTIVKNCTVNGKTFYWGYTSATFTNTTFNCPAGDYAVWTYSSPKMTFDNCTFNSSGKVINVYTDYGAGKYDITVNFKNCTVNNTGASLKPVLNINDSNMGNFKYILNITGDNIVNGVDVDNITCSRLFGFGRKPGNNTGRSEVTINGVKVWKKCEQEGTQKGERACAHNGVVFGEGSYNGDKATQYTDGYKDDKFEIIATSTGGYVKKCIYCGYMEPFYGELSNEIELARTVWQGQGVNANPKDTYKVNGSSGITVDYTATMDMTKLKWLVAGEDVDVSTITGNTASSPWELLKNLASARQIDGNTEVILNFTFDDKIDLGAFQTKYNAAGNKADVLELTSNMFEIADGGVTFGPGNTMTITCKWKEEANTNDPKITLKGYGLPVKNNWNGSTTIDIANKGCVSGTVSISPKPQIAMVEVSNMPETNAQPEIFPTIQIPIVGGCKTDEFTLYYGGGSSGDGGHSYYYPTPTPVPVIVIPPKTGDMTVWQSILHFLGIK